MDLKCRLYNISNIVYRYGSWKHWPVYTVGSISSGSSGMEPTLLQNSRQYIDWILDFGKILKEIREFSFISPG